MATIRRRGGKYQVQVRRVGQASVSKTFHEQKDARAWARLMEIKADKGDLLADPKALKRTTLSEIISRYRDTITPKKRSHETERIVLSAFLLHPICRKRLSELRAEDFATYRDERLREVKAGTVQRQLAIIKHAFEVARDEWGVPIQVNPLAKLQFKGADQRRERRLRPGELDRLMVAARKCRNPAVASIILFAVETAMRRGEILAIKRSHIDIAGRALLIPETKNGHSRTIPLADRAIALLQPWLGDKDRTFPITASAFRQSWKRLIKRAGIDDLRFHDLRHEAISRFFEMGLSPPEVALISGHRTCGCCFDMPMPREKEFLRRLGARPTRAFLLATDPKCAMVYMRIGILFLSQFFLAQFISGSRTP